MASSASPYLPLLCQFSTPNRHSPPFFSICPQAEIQLIIREEGDDKATPVGFVAVRIEDGKPPDGVLPDIRNRPKAYGVVEATLMNDKDGRSSGVTSRALHDSLVWAKTKCR